MISMSILGDGAGVLGTDLHTSTLSGTYWLVAGVNDYVGTVQLWTTDPALGGSALLDLGEVDLGGQLAGIASLSSAVTIGWTPSNLQNQYFNSVLASSPSVAYNFSAFDVDDEHKFTDISGHSLLGSIDATTITIDSTTPCPTGFDTASAVFNGTSSHIACNSDLFAALLTGGEVSVEFLVNRTDQTGLHTIYGQNAESGPAIVYNNAATTLKASGAVIADGGALSPAIAAGTWWYGGVTYTTPDATTADIELFVNGVSVGTTNKDITAVSDPTSLKIGAHGGEVDEDTFKGNILAFAVFPSALTSVNYAAHRTAATTAVTNQYIDNLLIESTQVTDPRTPSRIPDRVPQRIPARIA